MGEDLARLGVSLLIIIFFNVLHILELGHLLFSIIWFESTCVLLTSLEELLVKVLLVLHGPVDSKEANQLNSVSLYGLDL